VEGLVSEVASIASLVLEAGQGMIGEADDARLQMGGNCPNVDAPQDD
jgi:hypothetical protein